MPVLFEGDVDDCAVVAAWASEACMQDCSAEDASVWEALSTFVCSFDGLGSFGGPLRAGFCARMRCPREAPVERATSSCVTCPCSECKRDQHESGAAFGSKERWDQHQNHVPFQLLRRWRRSRFLVSVIRIRGSRVLVSRKGRRWLGAN